MNFNNHNNLQYVVACLSTHSKWVKDFSDNFNSVRHHFNLTDDDEALLRKFMTEQGQRVLASSLIMEEKRWREVLPAIKYSEKIHGCNLKQSWYEYLNSFSITDAIPKTPLHESMQFIAFLISSKKLTGVGLAIAKYELSRNKAQSYEFDLNDVSLEMSDSGLSLQTIADFYLKVNPSLNTELFDCKISKLVYSLQNNNLYDNCHIYNKDMSEKEFVGFYKNAKTGMTCVTRLSELTALVMRQIKKETNLQDFANKASSTHNISNETLLPLVKTLNKNNVIIIYKNEAEHAY